METETVRKITDKERKTGVPYKGVVTNYRADRGEGWIECEGRLPDYFSQDKEVYFRRGYARVTENAQEPPCDLKNWKVAFRLHEGDKLRPKASLVLLLNGPNTGNGGKDKNRDKGGHEGLQGEMLLSRGIDGATELMHNGVVINYQADKGEGWIKSEGNLPEGFNQEKDVYFLRRYARVTENDQEPPYDLKNWKVAFRLHEGNKSKPKASLVLLLDGPNTGNGREGKMRGRQCSEWLEGEVLLKKGRNGETEIHIKSQVRDKPFYVYPDKISHLSLPLTARDKVKFQLQPSKTGELRVKTIKMHKLQERSSEDLDEFFASVHETLTSINAHRATLEMLPNITLWKLLAEDKESSFSLMHLLNLMLNLCQGKDANAGAVVEAITETDFTENIQDICLQHGLGQKVKVCGGVALIGKKEAILTFLQEVMRAAPHKLFSFLPLFNIIRTCPGSDIMDLIRRVLMILASSDLDASHWSTLVPFQKLKKQNRMRPEFSALLRDFYPELQDDLTRDLVNKPAECLEKSMFFWGHNFLEDSQGNTDQEKSEGDRSKRNTKEAEMVMAMALFLIRQGYHPSQITILAAYLGQQKILRNMQADFKKKYANLFCSEAGVQDSIIIQTVDMYQGDENDIVLISLTRGNNARSIGFMKLMNRRCVAQSRAKCGMYFFGHIDTYLQAEKGKSVWQPLLKKMFDKECVGTSIVIQCKKHKIKSQKSIPNAQVLMSHVDNSVQLCNLVCGDLFDCKILEHACKKSCSPPHRHDTCFVKMKKIRPTCGHVAECKCHEKLSEIPCVHKVEHTFSSCGHKGMKKCYVQANSLTCKHPCPSKMACNLHPCQAFCGDTGKGHNHAFCLVPVKFTFADCKHKGEKKCWESPTVYKCKEITTKQLPKCRHVVQEECYTPLDQIVCPYPCKLMMSCKEHNCGEVCGEVHNHDDCQIKVKYIFPKCKHPSPKMKKCSEPISWLCNAKIIAKAKCGHDVEKKCSEQVSSVVCPNPCVKLRSCGHPCTNKCGDSCEKGSCTVCEQFRIKFRKEAESKKKKLERDLKNAANTFVKFEVFNHGDTKAEYYKVKDKVMNYIQQMHDWAPQVTKIEKVKNLKLEIAYEEAKINAFGHEEDYKFHGTSDEGVEGITKNGFRMPDPPSFGKRPGMYGQGIYFATDSSKSAQPIYTKGSHKLLLCHVLLGRSKVINKSDSTLSNRKLREGGFDSVYAPRGTEVKNDEFVIFNPSQALPVYIIHFVNGNGLTSPTQAPTTTKPFEVIKLKPSRSFSANDPKDNYFRIAEAHFMRMAAMKGQNMRQHKIKEVEYVYNQTLEARFERTRGYFQSRNIPSDVVLAFHGTPAQNIMSILKSNLDPARHSSQAHGRGHYFSEFPQISQGYGDGLILFKTLPGKEYSGRDHQWPNHNSKKVQPEHTQGYGDMLIIDNPDQFMPFFVYHLGH